MIFKLLLIRNRLLSLGELAYHFLGRHWLKLSLAACFSFLLLERNLSIEFRFSTEKPYLNIKGEAQKTGSIARPAVLKEANPKRQQQLAYVRRFARVAQSEQEKFGIPASINLAQGLLESDAGNSPIARRNNNHFGIKCFSRNCQKGHCSNFTDDSHKDFFRAYENAWESWRAHSLMLQQNSRYHPLFQLDHKDYRSWARGLAKAGYATDPDYAKKLVNLIEELDLYAYDS